MLVGADNQILKSVYKYEDIDKATGEDFIRKIKDSVTRKIRTK